MGRQALGNRQIVAAAGAAADLNVQREFVRRPTAVGSLMIAFDIDVSNPGGAPLNFDPYLCVGQIASTLTMNNGHAPVCNGHPLSELQEQAVLDKWQSEAEIANLATPVVIPAAGNVVSDFALVLPLANNRTPGVTKQGEVYGEHIQDFQFTAANLLNGQPAGLAIGPAGWHFTVFSVERPSNPFLGSTRMFRRMGIADSTQTIGYGFVEDVMLFGNVAALENEMISIRRGVTTVVENSLLGMQSNVSLRGIGDPDFRPDNDRVLVPICRGDNERITRIPAGRVEMVDYTGAWPANTIMHTSVIQPMGLAVAPFLHKWQGAIPIIEGDDGPMELITAKTRMNVAFNFVPIHMKNLR